ncbi:lactonase family protein [Cellulomonas sp. H30R-01]|uniref:lactonase family protein n=1 Tax=Cellulomonas sp. H30R-01 TaxID=2704467 RepID=UPI00138DAFA5|nr:beta-propeller fold lactonase family protein [Cellulomonas sp. H30R-01]QHT58019.1 lactonase family protein [Cellulomonas sp. H30R-01]
MTQLWIGTYPEAGAGTPVGLGEGIWRVTLDDATGALGDASLVVTLPSPSFVAASPDGRTLHAALEVEDGEVVTLAVDEDGGLTERSRRGSGGAYPCHVSTDVDGLVAVANYASGHLGLLAAEPSAGDTAPATYGHEGSGPVTDRQEGTHAHFAILAPGGRHLLVADLGTDELRRYRVVDGGVEPDGIAATLPPGTGPRHVGFAADGRTAYVAGELDVQVHVLTWDPETATGSAKQTVPAVVGAATGDDTGRTDPVRHPAGALPSHLAVDGDELLVTVRGADVLTRYAIGPDGKLSDGRSHPLGGHWPRHFAVVGPWVVVALERAHRLVVLAGSGEVVSTLDLPSPTCVLPA